MVPPELGQWLTQRAADRNRRLQSALSSIEGTRDVPDRDEVNIGSARRTRGVILFADTVGSTRLAQRYAKEPEKMLLTLNLLIPTLMDAARCYGGEFEKNTGDGILAYFGVGDSYSDESAAVSAVGAAEAMLWATKQIVNPQLKERGLHDVKITVGADLGDVLLARIGLQRIANGTPMVAVGLIANRAAKIQGSAAPGQARIGEDLFSALPKDWRQRFGPLPYVPGWPFSVRKSASEISREEYQASQEAANTIALGRQPRGLLPFYVPPAPAIPPYVSPDRPYRVYFLRILPK